MRKGLPKISNGDSMEIENMEGVESFPVDCGVSQSLKIKVVTTFKDGKQEFHKMQMSELVYWQLSKSIKELESIESFDVYIL